MRPAFRPDKALDIANAEQWRAYMQTLGNASGTRIDSFSALKSALCRRLDYFVDHGCLLTDHSLSSLPPSGACLAPEQVFDSAMSGKALSSLECESFRSALLHFLGGEYHARGLVMQLHIGAVRNCNSQMFQRLGPDAGYDVMGDFEVLEPVRDILDSLESEGLLPKTVLYCLNQKDTHVLGALSQCYCQAGVPGKVQLGVPWWHLDNKEGILYYFQTSSNLGIFAQSIGMLTDSRSFLSYVRHGYYRRLLCRYMGELMENGEYAASLETAGSIVHDICCNNIKNYLGL